jgi:hypothetical protein
MKKFPLILTLSILTCLPSMPAALLLDEGFDYEAGLLVPANGGTGFSSAWANSGSGGTQVVYPGLAYSDSLGNSLSVTGGSSVITSSATDGAFRDFSAIAVPTNTTTTYWLSFIGSTDGAPFGASGDEASIQLRSGNTNILSIGAFGTSANWRLRASGGVGGTLFSNATGVPSSAMEAFVVIRLDVNTSTGGNDAVYFWLNPELDEAPSEGSAIGSISGSNIWDTFSVDRLRTGLNNSGTAESKELSYDEFRFGTTFTSVAPVPEPAALSLLGLSGFLLVWRQRHRISGNS